ncbi:MAG TPA: alpha/beta fold hydrolase [Streptosporangiaceae bacterium]|nr:alpha/beta fold hydrolase [Streptosporangiaceae bacterium]
MATEQVASLPANMTLTRSASAGAGRRRAARAAVATFAVAALGAAAATSQRASIAASLAVLGHLRWLWIPAAIVLEAASMAAFAFMLRRLLAAGGARVGARPMLATSFAANALSVSIPLAGPELATAFTFRRFTRQGADAPLAGWSLVTGGVVSAAAGALFAFGGGLASGNGLVTGFAVPGGVLAVAALLVLGAAARRPRLRDGLERRATWALQHVGRLMRRPAGDPGAIIGAWAERLSSLQLAPSGWVTVTGLGVVNWLADAAVLVVSIRAAGAPVPWNDLLLVYGSGVAAQSLNITPGGLGVAEGTLSLALVATGLRVSQALAAVLLYRLASFWLVAVAGWMVLWLLHRRQRGRPTTALRDKPAERALRMDNSLASHTESADTLAALRRHELVLLHGQPGSAADWHQVTERLPALLHAVAADRPGYGSSQLPAGGFAANARAVIDDLDRRGIDRAVLVGHSFGGGVAMSAASLAPERVEAVVLLASVGPGCANVWDRVLAARGTGPLCALVAWKLTPWIARARLAVARRRAGRSRRPDEHVNWQVWGHRHDARGGLWRTFLAEQRALLRELDELERALPAVEVPVLLLADPRDTLVPVETARRLAQSLPDARLQLINRAGHHLPMRAAGAVADAIGAFLAAMDAEQLDSARSAAHDPMAPALVA